MQQKQSKLENKGHPSVPQCSKIPIWNWNIWQESIQLSDSERNVSVSGGFANERHCPFILTETRIPREQYPYIIQGISRDEHPYFPRNSDLCSVKIGTAGWTL